MSIDRVLDWEGCYSVRDLGGLPTADGRAIRSSAIVRADHTFQLTAVGWSAHWEHGVRTVIELHSEGIEDRTADTGARPQGLTTVRVGVEDLSDEDFKRTCVETGLWGTPIYYRDVLARWPERQAASVRAVAEAAPGGVLVHCGRGRDRTGLLVMLLLALALAGVVAEDIAADYELSNSEPVRARLRELLGDERDDFAAVEAILAREQTTSRKAMLSALDGFDAEAYLRAAGLSAADVAAVRARMVG